MTESFVAACVTMRSGRDPAANRDAAARMIRDAAAAGAAFVQTPEITNLCDRNRAAILEKTTTEEKDETLAALREGRGYQTASAPGARASERYVLLSFAPDAKAGDIASFFKRFDASVVDGPRANGFFKVRVGDASLSAAQVDAIAARMKSESAIVSFVAPSP